MVDNYHAIGTLINYILTHSCAKTLARKYNLGTRKKAFKKFGINLTYKGYNNKGKIDKKLSYSLFRVGNYKKLPFGQKFKTGKTPYSSTSMENPLNILK